MSQPAEFYWKADPHQWGPGRTHVIHKDGTHTLCGRPLLDVPGQPVPAVEYDCRACAQAFVMRERNERQEREWRERQAAWQAGEAQRQAARTQTANCPGPIETRYRGYRFRSRLEARWAVFLDKMKEPWEYEKEGFRLANGYRYLPDFWLPRLHLWLETKGEPPTEQELTRCRLLRDATNAAAAIFHGLPCEYWGKLFCWDLDETGGSSEWEAALSSESDRPFRLCFWVETRKALYADPLFQREIGLDESGGWAECVAQEARAARLEYGEQGA